MPSKLSFFNWSLKKTLNDETNHLLRAKYKIIFTVFILFSLKGLLAFGSAVYNGQHFQAVRALAFLVVYVLVIQGLLNKRLSLASVAHAFIAGSLLLIYTNLFMTAKSVNIVTIQFIFTLILCSFYLLNAKFGIIYSALGILPVMVSLLVGYKFSIFSGLSTLSSPGYEMVLVLNFITIIFIPYLFYQAFCETLDDKEKLNMELQRAVESANKAVKMKSEFLSTMSHELRTPLNTVIGTTDLLLSEAYAPHQTDNLKDLKFSANCLLTIINDILDYNKLDSSKLNLEFIYTHLHQLLREVSSGLAHQCKEKGLNFHLTIDEDIQGYEVLTDPTRITQIMYNLIGNAIKFTPQGEVKVRLSVLSKTDDRLYLRFSVEDTGIGIDDSQREVIFEPFNQASTSITRTFGGTGLGLSIVQRLLSLFDSKINLTSKLGRGSVFYFDINFSYRNRSADAETVVEVATLKDLSDLKIMVAEDNMMNRVLVKKIFAKWNNDPVFAEDGQEAIETASFQKFDIILMDLHMPRVDGYTAAKAIKADANALNSETTIVAFTASISPQILAEVSEAGMCDYIYKPFNAEDIYRKLRNLRPLNFEEEA